MVDRNVIDFIERALYLSHPHYPGHQDPRFFHVSYGYQWKGGSDRNWTHMPRKTDLQTHEPSAALAIEDHY